ncbi:hypothetical protein BOX15_Mlig030117g1 [Macrostomum lignano]|uniref:Uncharacterized protein n=1 Tax=Macrostomum lignano TaxID=282301 RepID=A0A267ENE3_9PLAT|nr:hypothetical protein BOX15_Mlig030117g1 [Macrostomum lignano]
MGNHLYSNQPETETEPKPKQSFDAKAVASALKVILRLTEVRPSLCDILKSVAELQVGLGDAENTAKNRVADKKEFFEFQKELQKVIQIAKDILIRLTDFGRNAELLNGGMELSKDQLIGLLRSQLEICTWLLAQKSKTEHERTFLKAKEESDKFYEFLRSQERSYFNRFFGPTGTFYQYWKNIAKNVSYFAGEFHTSFSNVPKLPEEAQLAEFESKEAVQIIKATLFTKKYEKVVKDARTLSLLQKGIRPTDLAVIAESWNHISPKLEKFGIDTKLITSSAEELFKSSATLARDSREVFRLLQEFQKSPSQDKHTQLQEKLDSFRQAISEFSSAVHGLMDNFKTTIADVEQIQKSYVSIAFHAKIIEAGKEKFFDWLRSIPLLCRFVGASENSEPEVVTCDPLLNSCFEKIQKFADELHDTSLGVLDLQRHYRDFPINWSNGEPTYSHRE